MNETLFQGDGFVLPLVRSTLLPARFRHGFTTRAGGVSGPPFDSLNLGAKWGDAPENVAENRRRLRLAAGSPVFFATQVHGAQCARVVPDTGADAFGREQADAVIATDPGTAVGVYVADCVPALIADTRTGAVAAVHAGWRGTVAGVLPAALRRMARDFGSRLEDLRVAIGPSIGPCCFEVGPEVVSAVEGAFAEARATGAIIDQAPRSHVDLWLLNRLAAESAGLSPAAIDVAGMCTACDPGRFFSYRRDKGATGQLAAFIVCERDQDPRSAIP